MKKQPSGVITGVTFSIMIVLSNVVNRLNFYMSIGCHWFGLCWCFRTYSGAFG